MKREEIITASAIVYGGARKISEYGIASVVNELMAADASDIRLNIRVLAQADTDKSHLYAVRNAAAKCCKALEAECSDIEILRTGAVAGTAVDVTGYGFQPKRCQSETDQVSGSGEKNLDVIALAPKQQAWHRETMRAGQDIVLTNYIGMEGTLRILDERMEELNQRFTKVFLNQIRDKREEIFAAREILAAKAEGVSAMRQVGDGGIFAALYRLAKEADTGLVADLEKIAIRQETIEICEYYRLNPYQLASAGNMLMVCENGEALADALREKEMTASVIGRLTGDNDKVIRNGEDTRYIDRPAPDELMKIFK